MTGEAVVNPWVLTLVPLVASGVGAYFGSYLKKKGENLATREDIGDVLQQVRAVTTVTKEIESKISSDVWDRQKRWELKREVLFQAMKRLADLEDALLSLDSVLQVETKEDKTGNVSWTEASLQRSLKWTDASSSFDETRLFVSAVCDKETIEAFEDFGTEMNRVGALIQPGKNSRIYREAFHDRERKRIRAKEAVRKELGIG